MALEGESVEMNGGTDGWGNEHVCKNREEMFRWIEGNRVADLGGI